MSISAKLHQVKKMYADGADGFGWLAMEDRDNNSFTIFMPHQTAQAIVDAWESAKNGKAFDAEMAK